jgi:hypothetical protein
VLQPNLSRIIPHPNHSLELHYVTGEKKLFDVTPYISGSWFGELGNYTYFKTVRLIENGEYIEWPNGQDLAPHELYELSKPIERITPCP